MIRAWLFGVACWVALGAFGLEGAGAARGPEGGSPDSGRVSAPAEHDPVVAESRPLVWHGLAERSAARAPATSGRPLALHCGLGLLPRVDAASPCDGDARVISRTSVSARRRVDLRREVFRTRPSRRVGGLEAAAQARS